MYLQKERKTIPKINIERKNGEKHEKICKTLPNEKKINSSLSSCSLFRGQVKPGDPGFVYDVRVDVSTLICSMDSLA